MTKLAMLSVQKITRFAEETGEPLVYHQSGSVKMARTERDERQIQAELAAGQERGLEMRSLSADDPVRTATANPEVIEGYALLSDLDGSPVAAVQVTLPRPIARAAYEVFR